MRFSIIPRAAGPDPDDADLQLVDRALAALRDRDPSLSRVVECRFFAGMTLEETAAFLQISPRTVKKRWARARAFILSFLESEGRGPGEAGRTGPH